MTAQPAAAARAARLEDAQVVARIYNDGIEDRIATFETEPRTAADIERRLDDRLARYPFVVVEHEREVVAWASAGSYRARPFYDPIAEHSVYVAHYQRGAGAGRHGARSVVCRSGTARLSQAGEPHLSRKPGESDPAPEGRLP